jgi:hypothetical protein
MTEQPQVVTDEDLDVVAAWASPAHPDGWIYLTHPDSGGETRIPDDESVLVAQTARGWVVVEPPEVVTVIPVVHTGPPPPPADLWIEMTHPDTGGVQMLPNDAGAIAGARDAGWVTTGEAEVTAAAELAAEVEGLTVAEVIDAVGGDPTKAAAVLAAEQDSKKPRSSLIAALEPIAAATPESDIDTTEQES